MNSLSTAVRFQHQSYELRKKFFKIFGASFQIFDPGGQVAFYSEQKAFKLKEDIRVYADEQRSEEVLVIKARSWLDFSAAYDVLDPTDGTKVGVLKRHGFSSLVKDRWTIMDATELEIGQVEEESLLLALIRRFVPFGELLPQTFLANLGDQPVAEFRQHFNPFIQKISFDFSPDTGRLLDRRLGLAAGILLCAIEKRQDSEGAAIEI
jgi:uncharacterized protein YxjI